MTDNDWRLTSPRDNLIKVGVCSVCGRDIYRQNGSDRLPDGGPAVNKKGIRHTHHIPWKITPTPGTPIQFTDGPIALMIGRDNSQFAHKYVNKGDTGTYCEPRLNAGWHLIDVGDNLYCACHESQFVVLNPHQQ